LLDVEAEIADRTASVSDVSDREVDPMGLRRALASFLTGVTVVTTVDPGGRPRGMTANSFTSVSLDPPLILVCIDRLAASHDAFLAADGFVVNVLADAQLEVAQRFASKRPDKFLGLLTAPGHSGAPILDESVAWLDCRSYDKRTVGDHTVLIGQVVRFARYPRRPLGFCQGGYVSLSPERTLDETGVASGATIAWVVEVAEQVPLAPRGAGWTLPSTRPTQAHLDDRSLRASAFDAVGLDVDVPLLFSVYDDGDRLTLVYRAHASNPAAEVGEGVTLFPVTEMPWEAIEEDHTASVLRRYLWERAADRFGIYTGSAESGRVAAVGPDIRGWDEYINEVTR
jgi:flavin reductase (DIM6/NTAB) family NADH-FMN oxidoreductase RutF